MKKDIAVLGLTSSLELVKEICEELNCEQFPCDVKHFADGEIMVQIGASVRGKHVYIVQSTCNPVSSTLMETLICIDACKRASASEITVVCPYFGYARQDRKAAARQPITSKLVADLLQTAGASRVVTVDLHAAQIQGFFDIPIDDLTAMPMLSQYFRSKGIEDLTIVSPDHGGAGRARKLCDALTAPLAIIDKRRLRPNEAQALSIIGDVKDRNVIICDDMCDTAGTLVAGVDLLKREGAKDIYFACTHPVFSGPAVERLEKSPLKEVVVTNTICLPEEKKLEKLTVLSIAPMLAKTIEHIEENKPVSFVFDMYND